MDSHRGWLEKHLAARQAYLSAHPEPSAAQADAWRQQAKETLPPLVAHWAQRMGVQPTGITVTAARTRFGSCSGKNRLSFSLYLMAYPETAIEYVVVHELAHIRHHDHSPAFYREVEAYLARLEGAPRPPSPVIPPFCAVHSILRRRPFNRAVVFL